MGSLGFLLLIINKRAVIPVLFALAQGSSQPVFPALPERLWDNVVSLPAASDPTDDLLPLHPSPLPQRFNCCSTRGLISGEQIHGKSPRNLSVPFFFPWLIGQSRSLNT